ncbi:MAG TPA: hypothetical protein VIE68_00390 [Gemmatimonadota bacterium]
MPAPPASGIVPRQRAFAVGAGLGHYGWEDPSLYDDLTMTSLSIERILVRGIRGRAAMAAGKTTLSVEEQGVDAWIMPFDLQLLVSPDFGPFRRYGVMPYAVGGFGTLITNPSGDVEELDLTTRSQSQWTYGGGIQARFRERFEARFERTIAGVRLADPVEAENRDTQTVHNRRWEGRLSWLF